MKYSPRLSVLSAVVALAALCGCSGSSMNPAPTAPASSASVAMQGDLFDSLVQPDTCSRLKSHFIDAAGGHIPLQECNGTDGKFTYGANNAGEHTFWQVESYRRNPNPLDCGVDRGEKVYLFVTVYLSAEQAAFQTAKHESMFTNSGFSQNQTFTLYEYAAGQKSQQKLGSPNANKQLVFPSPFNGKTIQGQINICFELASP